MKVAEREHARQLRREHGLPVKEIAERVGVSVSSVSLWVRDIELTAEQQAVLDARNPVRNGQLKGTAVTASRARTSREAAQAHGRRLALENDPLHRAGCMLHWAEGSKRRNTVLITNADADLLKTCVRMLQEFYGVADEQFFLSVNCFDDNGLTVEEIEDWWLERLGLPTVCLRAPTVNRASTATKRRRRVLPYGTACIGVNSTFIVQSIYGAIQEYAGIERPEWLDL